MSTTFNVPLYTRDAKGRIAKFDPFNLPENATDELKIVAQAICDLIPVPEIDYDPMTYYTVEKRRGRPRKTVMADAAAPDAPKGKRGRPAGYKCSAETVRAMVAKRQANLKARKLAEGQARMSEAWTDTVAAYAETDASEAAFQMEAGA